MHVWSDSEIDASDHLLFLRVGLFSLDCLFLILFFSLKEMPRYEMISQGATIARKIYATVWLEEDTGHGGEKMTLSQCE